MSLHRANTMLVCRLTAALSCWALSTPADGQDKYWDIEPYRIYATLAIDAPGDLTDQLAQELPAYLQNRAAVAIGAVWRLETQLSAGRLRHQLLGGLDSLPARVADDEAADVDKQLFVTLVATPWGYELAAREYDHYVGRWGTTVRATTRQRDALAEELFALMRRAVAPLAQFQLDPDDENRVVLALRGASLPPPADDLEWIAPGEALLPILRRVTREGELVADGIQVVPWTYIEARRSTDAADANQRIVGRVLSGTRRPFGVRRRGRVEQVAIALQAEPREAIVRLRSRTQEEKPLVAYEVYVQNSQTEAPIRLVGTSDENGEIRVGPGPTAIRLLYVKSGGEVLARLPIVPGAVDRLDVPLPDDDARLRAAARLESLREDLVDLVARRNIFMARIRQLIENEDFSAAKRLLDSLNELPGRAQFNQALEREARLHRASDPQVQRRIDQLFSATQAVLGRFLDPRPINELHEELRQAQQQQGPPERPASEEVGVNGRSDGGKIPVAQAK